MIDQPLLRGSGRSHVILRFSAALTLVTVHTQHLISGVRRHVFPIKLIQYRLITSMKEVDVPGEGRAERTDRSAHSNRHYVNDVILMINAPRPLLMGGGAVATSEDWLNPVCIEA